MTRFNIPKMKCGGCVATIEKAVKAADPAAEIVSDLPGKTVDVRSGLSEARLREILAAAGFPAA